MGVYAENYSFEGKNPFYVVPWHEDFLRHTEKLVQDFVTAKGLSMQDIVLVFPNARPRLYLTSRYREIAKKNKKALILPGMYTATEFYSLCLQHFERGLPFFSEMAPLDRYAVLYRIVRGVLEEKEFSHFSQSMETAEGKEELQMAKFYPWAVSLDRLFEECFRHLILPQNIEYADAEVSGFARSLLAELEEIFARYTEELRENSFTTPGFSLFRAAKYTEAYGLRKRGEEADLSLLPLADACADSGFSEKYFADFTPGLLRGKCIVFAGFVQLTKAEETIMRHFWERGACISLYTDPLVCTDAENAHYSCADHVRWIRGWQADVFSAESAPRKKEAEITFLPAYDLHSQLRVFAEDIRKDIAEAPQEDDFCAVVLPSPSLLLPVLHELPGKNVNISLGYPVRRTLLWQFAEIIFRLQQNRKNSLYAVADLLTLLHHPYTRMLLGQPGEETPSGEDRKNNFRTWRSVLFHAEKLLGKAGVFVDFNEFVTDEIFNLDGKNLPYELNEEMEVFVAEFFEKTVFAWEDAATLEDIGSNLNGLLDFLIVRGEDVWKRFPLDTEGLGRFLQNTVPAVMQNSLASEVLPLSALFGILEQLVAEERVPFEADPLIGLQVLGMLETRLLRFRKVYVLDCTESNLPGISSQDPLMPDSLRGILGLPDRQSRDLIIAHTFYRLINSAEEVYCYWQEGVQSSEIQSSKSIRSRFAEELIWKKQKELYRRYGGKLSKEQEKKKILRSVQCDPKAPARREKRSVIVSPAVKAALEKFAQSGFSAMALNAFLRCPVSFYFSYLAGIREQSLQEPGNNRQVFGIRFHEMLKDIYTANPRIKHNDENFGMVMEKFSETFNEQNWHECLAPDSYFMLKESGKFFLKKYWDGCADEMEVITVEHEFSHRLNHPLFSLPVLFKGKTDRVDKRGDMYCIVDYKTSQNSQKSSRLWKNTVFLDELDSFCQNWDSGKSWGYFEKLAEQLPDIQLPFYLYLFAKDFARSGNRVDEKTKINASWIFLSERKKSMEVFLVDEKYAKGCGDMWEMLYEIREKRVETVLDFLLNFMAGEKEWKCKEGKYCSYCPYAEYC